MNMNQQQMGQQGGPRPQQGDTNTLRNMLS